MSGTIGGTPDRLPAGPWDLVVVGGGIQGVCTLLEASRRGLRTLLLERDDFGGAASWSSLRILHGGLRYLQSADLMRFRESVAARRWFFRVAPRLVSPLPCLLPLGGRGLKRAGILRPVLAANDLFSARRNLGVPEAVHLPRGRVVGLRELRERFPGAGAGGWRSGAEWWDGVILDPPRLLSELLGWAATRGGCALNRVRVDGLDPATGRVVATDTRTDREHAFEARAVAVCVGPHEPLLGEAVARAGESLPPATVAWNVVLRRRLPATTALALESPLRRDGKVFFLLPRGDLTLAGTVHEPLPPEGEVPGSPAVERLVTELGAAIPGWGLGPDDVVRVMTGVLPGGSRGSGEAASRPAILDLGVGGRFRAALGVSAVKYTTAPTLARTVVDRISRASGVPVRRPSDRPALPGRVLPSVDEFLDASVREPSEVTAVLRRVVEAEGVTNPEDVVLRRADWGLDPERAAEAGARVLELLPSLGPSGDSDG